MFSCHYYTDYRKCEAYSTTFSNSSTPQQQQELIKTACRVSVPLVDAQTEIVQIHCAADGDARDCVVVKIIY
jgi:hypothetical protein